MSDLSSNPPVSQKETEVFYFGCNNRPGHFWYRPGMEYWRGPLSLAAEKIDGTFAPKSSGDEGRCTLTHLEGWTILAWWDYSVDIRPGSNSAVVAKGTFDFDEMTALLDERFPTVSLRQRIQLSPVHD